MVEEMRFSLCIDENATRQLLLLTDSILINYWASFLQVLDWTR